jgi:YtkA-like
MGSAMFLSKSALIAVVLLLTANIACAGGYTVNRKAGDYSVVITFDRNPPVAGNNDVSIKVTDASGRSAGDAKVTIDYWRPGIQCMCMPPMNYHADAQLKGARFQGKVDLSMPGVWNIIVRLTLGGRTWRTEFTVDVE